MNEISSTTNSSHVLRVLLQKYHSVSAARRRMTARSLEDVYGPVEQVFRDLDMISPIATELLDIRSPAVSIVIPAYNEEVEIIPTVLTFLWAVMHARIPTEIVAVDNVSTDRTRAVLERIGVRTVSSERPGLRYSRAAGVSAVHSGAKYVWLVDADTRALAPIADDSPVSTPSPLSVAFSYMERHSDCVATSTGIVYEYQVPLRRVLRRARIALRGGLSYSCWTGPNQFVRRDCLMAIGGIDLTVDGGEDHHRIYQLWRYARDNQMYVRGADREPALLCPVHTSDRRNATLSGIARNLLQQIRKPRLEQDSYGLPAHPQGVRHKDLFRRERGAARRQR